jgi:hypothetical protein
VVANVRPPPSTGALPNDDEYDGAAATGRVGGGTSGKGAIAARAGDSQHADGNMSANALNLLHSILAQHSRDLLNHKEWINKNATNVAALREWVRHLRERVPSTSTAASQPQQPPAPLPLPSKSNRSHPDEALLTVATDLLAAAPPASSSSAGDASDASLADPSALPPMQLAPSTSAQQQQYLQHQQVLRQQHQATQQRLSDLGESVWQLRNEHASARLELARRLTWADVETLLVQLFSGGSGRSDSPTSSGSNGGQSGSGSGSGSISIGGSSSGGSAEFAIHNALPHSLARADGLPANAALSIRVRQLVSQQQQKQQQQLQTQTQTQTQAPVHQPYGPLSWPHPPPRIGAGSTVADSTASNHAIGSGFSGEGGAAPSRPFTAVPSRASNASPTQGGSENRFVLPSVALPQQHAQFSSGMPANGAQFSSASSSSMSTSLPPIANDALLPSRSLSDALSLSAHSQAKQPPPHIAISSRMAPARASAAARGNK